MLIQKYFSLFCFFLISFLLSSIIFLLSFLVSSKSGDKEKLSSYECGFNPFDDSRSEFDIKFYPHLRFCCPNQQSSDGPIIQPDYHPTDRPSNRSTKRLNDRLTV